MEAKVVEQLKQFDKVTFGPVATHQDVYGTLMAHYYADSKERGEALWAICYFCRRLVLNAIDSNPNYTLDEQSQINWNDAKLIQAEKGMAQALYNYHLADSADLMF